MLIKLVILNSQARQSSAERSWSAISRFYDNCKRKVPGKKGFPRFKKNCRSVEYKTTGWKLDLNTRKAITFTDKNNIGRLKLGGCHLDRDENAARNILKEAGVERQEAGGRLEGDLDPPLNEDRQI